MLITCCRIIQRTFLSFLTCRLEDAAISLLNVFTMLVQQWIKEWYKHGDGWMQRLVKADWWLCHRKISIGMNKWASWHLKWISFLLGTVTSCYMMTRLHLLMMSCNRCVIAELFLEGTSIFSLSQLFKYRSGEYNPDNSLDKIDDENIKVKDWIRLYWKQ